MEFQNLVSVLSEPEPTILFTGILAGIYQKSNEKLYIQIIKRLFLPNTDFKHESLNVFQILVHFG